MDRDAVEFEADPNVLFRWLTIAAASSDTAIGGSDLLVHQHHRTGPVSLEDAPRRKAGQSHEAWELQVSQWQQRQLSLSAPAPVPAPAPAPVRAPAAAALPAPLPLPSPAFGSAADLDDIAIYHVEVSLLDESTPRLPTLEAEAVATMESRGVDSAETPAGRATGAERAASDEQESGEKEVTRAVVLGVQEIESYVGGTTPVARARPVSPSRLQHTVGSRKAAAAPRATAERLSMSRTVSASALGTPRRGPWHFFTDATHNSAPRSLAAPRSSEELLRLSTLARQQHPRASTLTQQQVLAAHERGKLAWSVSSR